MFSSADPVFVIPLSRLFILSGISNFSVQYNFQAIAIALIVMSESVCTSDDAKCKDGEQAEWVDGVAAATVFVGAIVGQLSMGYLGDVIGRSRALFFTLLLASFGAAGSSLFSIGSPTSVYAIIICFRFLLGIGAGGVYPLSATKAAEDSSTGGGKVNSVESAKAFFWQAPGAMTPWYA
jgi:MFS transporter, PHS family, inorganic phosphate transporter